MKYRYISDAHMHSDCSPDAFDPMTMMCEQGAKLGLYSMTLTDHCEANAYYQDEYNKSIRQSFFESKKASVVFRDRLHVYSGMELGQPMQDLKCAEEAVASCDFDFILASVHNINGYDDFYSINYAGLDPDALFSKYLNEVLETVEWGKFDSLAHLTYPLRYMVGEHRLTVHMEEHAEKVDRILSRLAKSDKALEINTSGLRQSIGATLPDYSIVKRFHELGGRYVTIGSDAHRWADIGAGIEEGLHIALKAGFEHFTVFSKHTPHLLPIM